jgi:hypothetical protein
MWLYWTALLFFIQINAELIPRRLLFSEPKYSQVTISPDGRQIAFLAPNEQGISNVFVKCITCRDADPITFEKETHISSKSPFICLKFKRIV